MRGNPGNKHVTLLFDGTTGFIHLHCFGNSLCHPLLLDLVPLLTFIIITFQLEKLLKACPCIELFNEKSFHLFSLMSKISMDRCLCQEFVSKNGIFHMQKGKKCGPSDPFAVIPCSCTSLSMVDTNLHWLTSVSHHSGQTCHTGSLGENTGATGNGHCFVLF